MTPPLREGVTPSMTRERRERLRVAVAVAVLTLAITCLHLYTNLLGSNHLLHLLYRRLYYVPIILAAYVFGRRGGFLAAVAAAVPFGIHAHMRMGGLLTADGLDNTFEIAMYFLVGILFGTVRARETRRTSELNSVNVRLDEAYRKLEERAIQLITIQDYTASILRSITSGVVTVGPDGSVATANPAAERILGLAEADIVPHPISYLFADSAGIVDDVQRVLDGEIPLVQREATVTTRHGDSVQLQVSSSRMRAVGGKILGAVVTLEDVSDIQALTDQLIRADRLAAMGELTAGVAHEVRNPLGIIRGTVQLLEDANVDKVRARQAADIIKQEIDRLDRVIKALLDFGRPSPPTMLATNVSEVVADVVLFTQRFARQYQVTIEVSVPEEPLTVRADRDQLKQVLLNLVTNAVQAMEGTESGQIHISCRRDGEYVEIKVADTGPGITGDQVDKVFDPFFTTRSDGTGLGLTIVHRIIDQHGGRISLETSKEGATFRVLLPVMMDEE